MLHRGNVIRGHLCGGAGSNHKPYDLRSGEISPSQRILYIADFVFTVYDWQTQPYQYSETLPQPSWNFTEAMWFFPCKRNTTGMVMVRWINLRRMLEPSFSLRGSETFYTLHLLSALGLIGEVKMPYKQKLNFSSPVVRWGKVIPPLYWRYPSTVLMISSTILHIFHCTAHT